MEIYEIECITVDLEIAINSLKFISNIFEDNLEDEFEFFTNNDRKDLYKKFYSLRFLLEQNLCFMYKLKDKYQKQIEMFYQK